MTVSRRNIMAYASGALLMGCYRAAAQPLPVGSAVGYQKPPRGPLNSQSSGGPSFDQSFLGGSLGTGAVFTRASPGWHTNASGILVSATTNTPRFDYDPQTLQLKGLLLEDVSTNLIQQSQDVNQAVWGKSGTITVTGTVPAPDGTTTGQTFNIAGSGTAAVYQQMATTSGTRVEPSLWVKLISFTGSFTVENPSNNAQGWWTINPALLPVGVWQRITRLHPAVTIVNEFVGSAGNACGIFLRTAGFVVSASWWGFQLDSVGYTTSYIPTTTATGTRAADVLRYPIASVTGFDATKGSLVHEYIVEGVAVGVSSPAQFVGAAPATDYLSVDEFTAAGSTPTTPMLNVASASNGGSVTGRATFTTVPVLANVVHRGASSWQIGTAMAAAHDGVANASATGTTTTLPTIANLTIAGSLHSQPPVSQWARRTRYWPRQLPQAGLIGETT